MNGEKRKTGVGGWEGKVADRRVSSRNELHERKARAGLPFPLSTRLVISTTLRFVSRSQTNERP
jgi:hypothetical protein